jgi:hypothetical protein
MEAIISLIRVISNLFSMGWLRSATGRIIAIFTKILSNGVKLNEQNFEKMLDFAF